MASGNQFSDDSPFADKYGPPPVGKQVPHVSLLKQRRGSGRTGACSSNRRPFFLGHSTSLPVFLNAGRKRPMDQQFGGDVGGESDGDLGPDFQKRSRFDSPQVESELDRLDVPPATLRILVRQIDAGGIIGKVCRESRQFSNSSTKL